MSFPRASGVLLHPTSLPGSHGIGDLGANAHRFLDFMAEAGLKIWNMLPLGPTGYGDSPYQCFSAFAGNPLLIALASEGPGFNDATVDFPAVIPHKRALVAATFARFVPTAAYHEFVETNGYWLHDYALFMSLKAAHHQVAWTDWEPAIAAREPAAMAKWREQLRAEIQQVQVEQYYFFVQFHALKKAAAERGIQLMGDLPIYVAHDSADVWANPEFFELLPNGKPRVQAGVPPDYFSATGQLWGNPIYNWAAMKADGYAWWIRRMRALFGMFDLIRVDHFRGFEAYWEVPGDAPTAETGRWVKGPGAELFETIAKTLGPLPIVAENLGLITKEVEALREGLGFPGMSILQFAFGNDGSASEFLPHNYVKDRVVYTGTHDNDTTAGWWQSTGEGDSNRSAADVAKEKAFAMRYLATDGTEMHWALIRACLASVANTALIPMQDLLGLGSDARMNFPGRGAGNWGFRFTWDQLTPAITHRLRELVDTYDR